MTDTRYAELHCLYANCTNEQLRLAAQYFAACADEAGEYYRDHWIVVEGIIETRK